MRPEETPAEPKGICTICQEVLTHPVTTLLRGAEGVCFDAFHMACFKGHVAGGDVLCPNCRQPYDAYARSFFRRDPGSAERAAAARRLAQLDEDHAQALALQEQEGQAYVDASVHAVHEEDWGRSAEGTIGSRVRTRRAQEALDLTVAEALQAQLLEEAQDELVEEEEESEGQAMDDTPCPVCHRSDDYASFLLCDGGGDRCLWGGHLRCMGLRRVPAGTWLCATCRPPPTRNALRMRRFWQKRRERMGDANFKAAEARARKIRRAKRAQRMVT